MRRKIKFKTGIILLTNISIILMIVVLAIFTLSDSSLVGEVAELGLSSPGEIEISKLSLFKDIFINNLLVFTVSILLLGIGTQIAYTINLLMLTALAYFVYIGTGDLANVLKLFVYHLPFEIIAFWSAILIGYSFLENILVMRKNKESGRIYFKENLLRNSYLYALCVIATFIGALIEVYISGGM